MDLKTPPHVVAESDAVRHVQAAFRHAVENSGHAKSSINAAAGTQLAGVLGADANPSIKTLAKIADALGLVLNVRLLPAHPETGQASLAAN